MAPTEPDPSVKRMSELIKKHSIAIREAQKQLRDAVRAAEQDGITEERLYT